MAFDRYLLPSAYKRQQWLLLDSSRQLMGGDAYQTIYDPVALTVTITGPGGLGVEWLTPGQQYYLVLPVARDDRDTVEDISGFRAIDRAPLASPREYVFRAGPLAGKKRLDPVIDFCADVMPIFKAKCSSATCHGAAAAAGGLILETSEGILQTAVNRVAHGSNTGRQGQTEESARRIFGIDMSIIAPGDPGSSWLTYKIELAPPTVLASSVPPNLECSLPPGSAAIPPRSTEPFDPGIPGLVEPGADALDRAVLNDYVLGREMPYPVPPQAYQEANPYAYTPLTFQERETIRIWIANMGPTSSNIRDCGACLVVEGDGGR